MRPAHRLLSGIALLALACSPRPSDAPPAEDPETAVPGTTPSKMTLYFPGDGEMLLPEQRSHDRPLLGAEGVREVLDALLAGPRNEGLHPPLPAGVSAGTVQINSFGVVYVDLLLPEDASPPRWGSREELLAAYSLVNSICTNVADARSVSFLWNGGQPTTFAGNLDTRRPLLPRPRLNGSGE